MLQRVDAGYRHTERLYHLAIRAEWERARDARVPYDRSTRGRSLEDEGFVHCSFAHQVEGVAERFYADCADVVVLVIDPALVAAVIRVENTEGGEELFPHIYGPIPIDAVVEVRAR
jgi:uncharacterized protein (DUF952 family)